ncbi:uncharacterized protein CANTADRAFT_223227 [Suhomyces tanzawaensis NRRL Y-17324]|uniref:Uncharacterized protein n=1 Tax=Suhomyces tanzawaensis NRRL Y-17324 TaxID=984487 RepID=A0A1E4SKF9_9ASCO|nr:uncharacterized protein CANTADRAFT_223227 [Suhomyces tanzawaensis NRRL Y-17324]ODV79996.1 hypothetical protein CANTADRAFT_223227 [Suhomyces tanzawaensis NRRL Y-17324]
MSGEKDRRLIFGSRISSMFNHTHGPSLQPTRSTPTNKPASGSLKLVKPTLTQKASNASLRLNASQQAPSTPRLKREPPLTLPRTTARSPAPSSASSAEPSVSQPRSAPSLRRKPPPLESQGLSADVHDPNSNSKINDTNMNDIIGTLENEIDTYLRMEDPKPSGGEPFKFDNDDYSTTSLTSHLRLSRSPPLMELSDYNNDFYDSTSSVQLPKDSSNTNSISNSIGQTETTSSSLSQSNSNSNSIPTSDVPYPLSDPFESPVQSNFNPDISYDTYAAEIPRNPRDEDPLEASPYRPYQHRNSADTIESNRRSSSSLSQILHMNAPSGVGPKPLIKSNQLSQTPTRMGVRTNSSTFDAISTNSSDFITRTKTSATTPSTLTGMSSIKKHRQSTSISSLRSSNSYRNVNLASLKKSLNLLPGEGERSNYVQNIRRNAGTAFNDTGPGKWKLPTGIAPMDANSHYSTNGKYARRATGLQRTKKASGVELKHGHLQPRLLASEIDDGDVVSVRLGPKISTSTSLGKSPFNDSKSSSSSIAPGGSLANVSRNNSLVRTTTDVSGLTSDSQSVVTSSTRSESRRRSVGSSSSGSISDAGVGGYYQHPGYKHGEDEFGRASGDEDDEDNTDVEGAPRKLLDDEDEYDERPRLVLANPDNSDSD